MFKVTRSPTSTVCSFLPMTIIDMHQCIPGRKVLRCTCIHPLSLYTLTGLISTYFHFEVMKAFCIVSVATSGLLVSRAVLFVG